MSTNQQENRRSDVIRCEFCGEDYSVTYRRCPFCDDKAGVPAESRSRSGKKKGGRRVAPTNKRGGGYGGAIRPVQVIGIALSIILIIAAIYIVYSVLAPLFGGGSTGDESVSQPSVSVSQSDESAPDVSTPDVSTPDVSTPDVSVPDVSTGSGVVAPIVKATAVTLSASDVTAGANESFPLKATITPANTDDVAVWTSSDESVAKVDQKGVVTNVNTTSGQKTATITVKVGDVSASCTVRCKGGVQSSGTTKVNADGVINASGVNIRSTPEIKEGNVQASATNGAVVKVLEKVGSDWYKISYTVVGSQTATGYISQKYVTVK